MPSKGGAPSLDYNLCPKTVVSGSFRKHLSRIATLKAFLQENKIFVLSPIADIALDEKEEFVILADDVIDNHKILQDAVFAKIRVSTFLVLANFEGYLGKAAVLEVGYAISHGIDIFTVESVTDPNIKPYCKMLTDILPEFSSAICRRVFCETS